MASQSNGLCIQPEEHHTNKYPMATPEQMHGKEHIQRLHRKWNTQGWHRVAACFELHQTMQVHIFSWMSNLSIMCLPCQGVTYRICLVFFSGLTSAPLTSFMPSPFPARSCPALSYSVMFHSQVLLRRLHGSCAHVCTCICLYACVFLRPCRPCGVNLPTWLGLHPNGH